MISALLLEYVHQMLDRDNINFLKIVGQKKWSAVCIVTKILHQSPSFATVCYFAKKYCL